MQKCFLSLIIILSLLAAAGCGSSKNAGDFNESGYTEEQLLLGSVNRFAGVVTAGMETKVEKDSQRDLASVSVAAGDLVKAGDVLFTYDGTQAQTSYDAAAIELEQLRISVDTYASQKSALEAEKAYAPESEQLAYTVQIQELDTSIRETNYNISLKEKEVEKLAAALNNLEVRSPVNGKIKAVNSEGETDQNGSALPFIQIMQTDTYSVKCYINEQNLPDLQLGDEVIIRSRIDEQTWQGTVSLIDLENPTQGQSSLSDTDEVSTSSKYPFYVTLQNSDGLILGQHVFVEKDISYEEEPPISDPEETGTDTTPDESGAETAPAQTSEENQNSGETK